MSVCNDFVGDRRGNFAILASVLAVPLVMGIGFSLDASTIARVRAELQQAMDAAALAVAREGKKITNTQAQLIAENFLKENYSKDFSGLQVSRIETEVTVSAGSKAGISFGSLFGYDDWPVKAKSTADMASVPYEIALVLDTTGSMAGGKLQSMKDAVLGLIDTMSANTDPDKLKMAVVPFATFVNVGPQFGPSFKKDGRVDPKTGAAWLDLRGDSQIPQLELKEDVSRFEVFHNLKQEWAGCVETRYPTKKVAYDVTDAEPKKGKPESLFVPALSIDEPDSGYGNSYIASPVNPLDTSLVAEAEKLRKYGVTNVASILGGLDGDDDDDDNSGTGSTDSDGDGIPDVIWTPVTAEVSNVKGPNAGCDMQPLTPLTSNFGPLKTKVKSLEASGTTNIMEGVAWGWRVLSPGEPFTEGTKKSDGAEKIMIVLTDGANNFGPNGTALGSSYSSFGFLVDKRLGPTITGSGTTNVMNEKTLATCNNAKADGVEIFTIRLEEPDKATGMMLKDCASTPEHFFDAPSRTQLDEVFKKIRDRITKVRITS